MNISDGLNDIIKDYQLLEDYEGMSPTNVYKLNGKSDNLFLKISNTIFNGTTYDVEREKELMSWLNNKLRVPNVLYYENFKGNNYLLMSEVNGIMLSEHFQNYKDVDVFVSYLAQSIKTLQKIDITNCPFDVTVHKRIDELEYLMKNNLADVDCCNWEEDSEFNNPQELFGWLCNNKPSEELMFSHGDLCGSNIIIQNNELIGFIDLGRAGYSDKWYDIAFCVREIRHQLKDEIYVNQFFDLISETPDWKKIKYFTLLDELF